MHLATLAAAGLLIVLAGMAGAFLAGRAAAREASELRASLAQARNAKERLGTLTQQMAMLRHDLRGILSPAMLVSDRLLDNPDPGVKRAGEVIIRMVERMTARLAEATPGQDSGGPPAP